MATNDLSSQDHRDLFDIIDRLRSQGISKHVNLPQIVVCGDQSSGKSSVLEAISGMSFPTKDNLCTRFATELILRRTPGSAVSGQASIIPDSERTDKDKEVLRSFCPEIDTETLNLGGVIDMAKDAMGLSPEQRFSNDILRVELSGPEQPHLTIVDLPGLFTAGNKDQSSDDAKVVKDMVLKYMKSPRSIILAVVSAKNDFANQQVTSLTRELDPNGNRTLGLITKPDTLHSGSESEQFFVNLASNNDVKFRLGWHVLRNRDYPERNCTLAERNAIEKEFFSQSPWLGIEQSSVGVEALKPRLSTILKDQILFQLGSLLSDVEQGIFDAKSTIKRLGTARDSVDTQRRYLVTVSKDFTELVKAAVDGTYFDPFFGNALTARGYETRLRAIIQNLLSDFAESIEDNGQELKIIETFSDDESSDELAENESEGSDDEEYPNGLMNRDDEKSSSGSDSSSIGHQSQTIDRAAYVKQVKERMKQSRGRELPGLYNPMIIAEMFSEQCKPWAEITNSFKERIIKAIMKCLLRILNHITAPETTGRILQIISDGIAKLQAKLEKKIQELLDTIYTRHPITYNHYLTETVQKIQTKRQRKALTQSLSQQLDTQLPVNDKLKPQAKVQQLRLVDIPRLVEALSEHYTADMDTFAASSATDYMQAYYKVRLHPLPNFFPFRPCNLLTS